MIDVTDTSRAPRGIVRVGPFDALVNVSGWVTCEVINNNQTSADTFHVTFATSDLPDGYDVAWFASQKDMFVEIYMGIPKDPKNYSISDLTQFIFGQVDAIEYDPVNFVLDLSGRDLTRVFIDTKSTKKYPELTSSQIVTKLAADHGLTPKVTATTTQVGKFYEIDHVTMTDERSDWDLLIYLASVENFSVYVRGKTLYFGPKPAITQDTYRIDWTPPSPTVAYPKSNAIALHLSRSLTVSRGIIVVVRSWNAKQKKGFTAFFPKKAKSIGVGNSSVFGAAQTHVRTFPNLTQDQADQKAQALYNQIVAHEMRLSAELPGDTILDTTSIIRLNGTGTAYDQIYYPDVITRRLDWDGGFTMSVTAKNAAPESQVSL